MLRPTFFSSGLILMILKSCSSPASNASVGLAVYCFGVVAETFNAFGNLYKRAECGNPKDFAVNDVSDTMLREECLPDIRLKLLHAQETGAASPAQWPARLLLRDRLSSILLKGALRAWSSSDC